MEVDLVPHIFNAIYDTYTAFHRTTGKAPTRLRIPADVYAVIKRHAIVQGHLRRAFDVAKPNERNNSGDRLLGMDVYISPPSCKSIHVE